MENKKDNTDVKGQELQETIKDNINYYPLSPFNIDSIIKKTHKISTAIYLLTEHVDAKEPLRVRARECAISILKDIYLSSYHGDHKEKGEILSKIARGIDEMIVLFEIMFL